MGDDRGPETRTQDIERAIAAGYDDETFRTGKDAWAEVNACNFGYAHVRI
jgi:hypothetical protein